MTEARPTLSMSFPYSTRKRRFRARSSLRVSWTILGETWEVIFVDDGSRDASARLLQNWSTRATLQADLVLAQLRHQIAITAGMDRAEGESVVVMDADLQDPPEVVRDMIARWREGYDVSTPFANVAWARRGSKRMSATISLSRVSRHAGLRCDARRGRLSPESRQVILTCAPCAKGTGSFAFGGWWDSSSRRYTTSATSASRASPNTRSAKMVGLP